MKQSRDWENLRDQLFGDLAAKGGTELDLVDIRGYDMAFVPLERLVCAGRLVLGSPEVWAVRIAIRGSEFRPTYNQVTSMVATALSQMPIPAENPNAYRPVTAPKEQESTRGRHSAARDRARAAIKALLTRGPQKPYTEADALKWVPSTLPGSPADPATVIPGDDREEWIRRAYRDLYNRHKGRAPLAVRLHAAHLWRLSLAEKESTDIGEIPASTADVDADRFEDIPATYLGMGPLDRPPLDLGDLEDPFTDEDEEYE